MVYKLVKSQDSKFYLLVIIGVIAFFMFIYPQMQKSKEDFYQGISRPVPGDVYSYTFGLDNDVKADLAVCSRKCCGKQWPVSFDTGKDIVLDSEVSANQTNGTKYITSNLMCRGNRLTTGSGCVCIPQKLQGTLNNRGGNSINYY